MTLGAVQRSYDLHRGGVCQTVRLASCGEGGLILSSYDNFCFNIMWKIGTHVCHYMPLPRKTHVYHYMPLPRKTTHFWWYEL